MSWVLFESILLFAQAVQAVQTLGTFPRGPGLYYHPIKLLLILAIYCCWVRTCWWVDRDCRMTGLPSERWNPLLLAGGILGLLLLWVLPFFSIGLLALLALYLGPTLVYVGKRNEVVPEEMSVLTPRHFRQLLRRYLRLRLREPKTPETAPPIPIRFIGKSSGSKTDAREERARLARAQESQHYRSALQLVEAALQKRATDIHLEPTKEEMTVRFRIDGILHPGESFSRSQGDPLVNIFKVLADLDITEKRKPQDGSFRAEVSAPEKKRRSKSSAPGVHNTVRKKSSKHREEDFEARYSDSPDFPEEAAQQQRQVDFRVATAGSVAGEKLVMRILDRAKQVTSLPDLGMRDKLREQTHEIVHQPHGLFVVCGPTGAGKSTTLYACLAEIDRFQKNVITVENPVEYQIDNVTQIEINPKAGKTFASELRSILRQDPDVILVGEVRDQETAEIACQAAQTGHMVFTTLHANDTITALARLLDLKVPPFLIANAASAVLGQRLVRVLCPKCKQGYRPNPELLRKANLPVERIKQFYRPGDDEECLHCSATGYHGRTGIFELLVVTSEMRELIRQGFDEKGIRAEAARNGMISLQQDGMRQVIEGTTSIDELLRVTK